MFVIIYFAIETNVCLMEHSMLAQFSAVKTQYESVTNIEVRI